MKMLAVLVIFWSHNGGTASQQVEMKSLEGCKSEIVRLNRTGDGIPKTTWMFCVERK